MSTYEIKESHEHCHACGQLTRCVVRFNRIRNVARKTALCVECAKSVQRSRDAADLASGRKNRQDLYHENSLVAHLGPIRPRLDLAEPLK